MVLDVSRVKGKVLPRVGRVEQDDVDDNEDDGDEWKLLDEFHLYCLQCK